MCDRYLMEQQQAPKRWKKKILGNKVLAEAKNPLRNFVQKVLPSLDLSQYPDRPKEVINLSMGDPTISPEFRTAPSNLTAINEAVGKHDGYTDMQGLPAAREAVAKHFGTAAYGTNQYDVFMSAGGSMALWCSMNLLAGEGDNFLFPTPGFPLSLVIAKTMHLEPRFYQLQADQKWNASIEQMEKLIDDRTRFILVNDPSNPLGSCWSEQHKRELLELAKRKGIPLLVDEIYEKMTYDEVKVPTFAELVRPDQTDHITIFKCSGLTKRYLGPGWRMGWVVLFAGEKQKAVYRKHLRNILNIVLMPNTIMQCAVPAILGNPQSQAKIDDCMAMMKANQATVKEALEGEDYCTFGHSSGAFYATVLLKMERFKEDVSNTLDFSKLIYAEENVKFFPGDFFVGSVPFVRLVLSCNNHIVQDFIVRFKRFCRRHLKE